MLDLPRIAKLMSHVTESSAIAAARHRGRGNERAADEAAVEAMRRQLNDLPIDGVVACSKTEVLAVGERVGRGNGLQLDVAVDPLECVTACAKGQAGSMSLLAMAEAGNILHVPDLYMEKIAIGPSYHGGIVDLDFSVAENIANFARVKGGRISSITVLILDRPRHAQMIHDVRRTGASVHLLNDGDVGGIILLTDPQSGIDMYMGSGGATQGVLAAAALRCFGGYIQGRLLLDTEEKRQHVRQLGICPTKKYSTEEMVKGDCIFAGTGITNGTLLDGVRFAQDTIITDTLVACSSDRSQQRIQNLQPETGID